MTSPKRSNTVRRLNIIKGQIEGIVKMIEKDEDCLSVITQVKAVKNAFASLGEEFIKSYLKECVYQKKKTSEKDFDKIVSVLTKY